MTAVELAERLRTAAEEAVPKLEGEIRAPGLRGRVEVLRDRWGVPHVYAERPTDLFFAQGFLVASERLFQIEAARRLGLGRISELFGGLTLPLDRFVRALGWNRTAKRLVGGWDSRSMEMSASYNEGIRAWYEMMPALPVEYVFLEAEPWVPTGEEASIADAAAAVFLAWSLSRGWDGDLLRAEVAERLGLEAMRVLFPDPEPVPPPVQAGKLGGDPARLLLLEQALLPPPGQGSNAWVVGPSRSASGRPLLANDPHLATQLPPAWFEVHLSAPGYHAAGVALPFSPGVVSGHNERIAWGVTNSEGDVQDLFLEQLSAHGTSARFRQGWEPVQVHTEEIRVRHSDERFVVEARETRHGPLIDSYTIGIGAPTVIEGGVRRSYALRWVGFTHGIQPSAVWRLNVAHDWDSFREAARHWTCPGQGMVYADVEGNIGFQLTGVYPLRRNHDGTLPVPGWTGEY
ncbi:MAG TPA: penicillin acylase family protein, partial [Actinomycetota bacterium]|nr:penicillin acylase family protein [Actinomycetota bacterium]